MPRQPYEERNKRVFLEVILGNKTHKVAQRYHISARRVSQIMEEYYGRHFASKPYWYRHFPGIFVMRRVADHALAEMGMRFSLLYVKAVFQASAMRYNTVGRFRMALFCNWLAGLVKI